MYADFKHLGDQNHREKSCYVVSEFIAPSRLEFVKILIFISGHIQTYCQKNKKVKQADQILPEVYGTTLSDQLSYVTIFDCSLGRSHKTGFIV